MRAIGIGILSWVFIYNVLGALFALLCKSAGEEWTDETYKGWSSLSLIISIGITLILLGSR